uniref:Uncharacterized protein n=1 Tax=Elaeophora elaphi TaxID=1147741 RepID=A0A0R3S6R6_9BILA
MAYKNVFHYGDGYTTTYSSGYYAYQMRKSEKQRRISGSTVSRTTSILRAPTATYTSLRSEKPPFPHQFVFICKVKI